MYLQSFESLCLHGLCLLVALAAVSGVAPARAESVPNAAPGLASAFEQAASVEVLISLPEPAGPFETRADRSAAIARAQAELLAALGSDFVLVRSYRNVPALAGTLDRAGFAQLLGDPRASYLQFDSDGTGQLKEAVPAIGADRAQTMFNVKGKGVRVAVLDTGVDTDHPDLRAALVGQHCFTRAACPPSRTNESTSAEDDHGHGSNVAGIVASRGVVSSPGFAPEAELVAVKVNDSNDSGRSSDWIAGLDWVYENLSTNHVAIVNLSIGTNALYTGTCDSSEPALAGAIKNLIDAGVSVFAASGNRGSSTQMGAPACITGVVAVGATYDSAVGHQPLNTTTYAARWGSAFANCSDDDTSFGQIACFTNSGARLDLVAPGAPILSDTLNGRTELYWGTSQASPVAAGVAALMLQCNATLKPAALKDIMVRTGVLRPDPKNGKMFPSLRAFEAVQAACTGSLPAGGAGGSGAQSAGSAGIQGAAGTAGAPSAIAGAAAASTGGATAAGSGGVVAPNSAGSSGGGPKSGGVGAGAGTSSYGTAGVAGLNTAGVPAALVPPAAPRTRSSGCSAAFSGRRPGVQGWAFGLFALSWLRSRSRLRHDRCAGRVTARSRAV